VKKKYTIYLFILFFFLFTPWLAFGVREGEKKLYPIPLIEIQTILSRWLSESGFEVTRKELEDSRIQLKGIKGEEVWELTLTPHSPLASLIEACFFYKGHIVQVKVPSVWLYLDQVLRGWEKESIASEEIPLKVKRYEDSIVCIQGNLREGGVQFTGFVVDRRGLILSTSHDLKGVQEVTVYLPDGKQQKGRLVKVDLQQDLSLIDIPLKLASSIPLNPIRMVLKEGEKVYSIGCPNHHRTFFLGTIESPLRQVNHLPLVQVQMEVQPGSSGSPVFDRDGNLIGMVKGRFRGDPYTGFMIPLSTILEFLKEK
jgi:serine protease Do